MGSFCFANGKVVVSPGEHSPYYQLAIESVEPEAAKVGDIVFINRPGFSAEGIIIETGDICEGLFPGIQWVDFGRDASHILNYAVAREWIAKGWLYITREGTKPDYDETGLEP